jgi:hypothetical protein
MKKAVHRDAAQPVAQPIEERPYRPVWTHVRPGAQDHERVPSRRFNQRVYRDGRTEEVRR